MKRLFFYLSVWGGSILWLSPLFADPPWLGGDTGTAGSGQAVVLNPALQQKLQNRLKELNTSSDSAPDLSSLQSLKSDLAQNGATTKTKGTQNDNRGDGLANGMGDAAFSGMVSKALPMSPEQIVKLHALFDATQSAQGQHPGVPPRPVSHTLMVDLSPGATPPVIRLSAGFISTLVFVDANGAPWPIEAYDLGNPKAFNISWDQKSNLMMIQAISIASIANLMIKLQNLATPIMLTLTPDQQVVDYRVDLHIPGYGPQSNGAPVASGLPESANPVLLDILNGIAPTGSKLLTVSGADAESWLLGKKMYLRTRFKVISPGWLATMTSADGTNAYELQRTPFVLLTGNGQTIPIKISGF